MSTIDVAHIREQGQNMIIVPMRPDFGNKASTDQTNIEMALQAAARQSGLAGIVVTVWDSGGGRMAFRCPLPWRPFFESMTLQRVGASINKRITVG